MSFSQNLKRLMSMKDMKAVDLARATGLSEAAISDYLNGKKEPRGRQSVSIAKALNVSLDVLWETEFAQIAENVPLTYLMGADETPRQKIVDPSDPQKEALSRNYESLNAEGRKKLVDYSEDLVSSGRYKLTDID